MRKVKFRIWWIGPVLALVLTIGGLSWFMHRPPSSPEAGGAYETAQLLKTSKQLEMSFSSNGSPGELTRGYLGYLSDMQHECNAVNKYKDTNNAPAGAAGRLASSAALCSDLTGLVDNSKTIYIATLPLLTASPHLKRYQTLLFAGHIRNQQSAEVNTAISRLGAPLQNMEFQSRSLILLNQLQLSIRASKGLQYYPALGNFQNALLQEREQYWLNYGELSSLTLALQHELRGYCQALQGEGTSLQACHK